MRLGCQISISKGLEKSIAMAREVEANCFQFFTRNPRGGAAREIGAAEIEAWSKGRSAADIYPIVGHLPYTVNLSAPKAETYEFACQTIAADLVRMSAIGAEYLVVHPGSRSGLSLGEAIKRIAEALELAFQDYQGETMLLLETMSGHASEMGSFEEIGMIIKALGNHKHLGVCLDTCHLFATGYDLRQSDEVQRMLSDAERHVGIERIKCVHVNDSKFGPGLHKDRHELVGMGEIGSVGLMNVLSHPMLKGLPFLLETPVDDYRGYKDEIARIREWLQ